MGMGGQCHAPATLPQGKTQYPLHRRHGTPRTSLDDCGKSRPPLRFDPCTFQPIASCYSDCATLAHLPVCIPSKMCSCANYTAAAVIQKGFCCTCLILLMLRYCSLTQCSACYLDFCDIFKTV